MTEEESYEDIDISDIADDSEPFLDSEPTDLDNQHTEATDSETLLESSDVTNSEHTPDDIKVQKTEVVRSTKLPVGRIKNIMKMDPDVSVVSAEAVFLVTKATELFLETIVKETYAYTASSKRKTIAKKDLDLVINKVDCLCFLEGAMDF